MTATIPPRICPFCGQVSAVPHETQARCIEALHAEIEKTRQALDAGRRQAPPPSLEDVDTP
jgi:hypothetical protein